MSYRMIRRAHGSSVGLGIPPVAAGYCGYATSHPREQQIKQGRHLRRAETQSIGEVACGMGLKNWIIRQTGTPGIGCTQTVC